MTRAEQYARWRERNPEKHRARNARYRARHRDQLLAKRREQEAQARAAERDQAALTLMAEARRIADRHVRRDPEPWDNGLHGDCVGIAVEALVRWRYQPLAYRLAKAHRLVVAFLRKRATERRFVVSLDALLADPLTARRLA